MSKNPPTETPSRSNSRTQITGTFLSYRILESPSMVKQWRFPRTKKRRIRKKWAAVKANWRPDKMIYQMRNNCFVCHPQMAEKLRAQLSEKL